jgi:ATP-dependent Lon protease
VAAPGSAAGLVWTAIGGQVQYIECLKAGDGSPDRPGTLTLTGQLGEVLGESARIALSWTRAHAAALGLTQGADNPAAKWDVHVHLPAGAVQKDGPSAGVTLAVALVSLFTGRAVRADTAMTGELTLRGLVLPVGGIKEKALAARAAGLLRVVVPARNAADVDADLPVEARGALQVIASARLEDVLSAVFDPPLTLAKPGEESIAPAAKL